MTSVVREVVDEMSSVLGRLLLTGDFDNGVDDIASTVDWIANNLEGLEELDHPELLGGRYDTSQLYFRLGALHSMLAYSHSRFNSFDGGQLEYHGRMAATYTNSAVNVAIADFDDHPVDLAQARASISEARSKFQPHQTIP